MANKKISDLQLRSDLDATCNFPVDDASQTWRVTGAQLLAFVGGTVDLITGRTTDADPQGVDELLMYDVSAAAMKRVTRANFRKKAIATKTGAYTLGIEDDVILASAGSAFAVTLPTAVGIAGKEYTVKKVDSSTNAVTLTANGAETIDGATTFALNLQYESVTVISNGTYWSII